MQFQFSAPTLEKNSCGFYGQRREGIWFRSWRVEGTFSTRSRNPEFVFGFQVERLELRVGERPVSEPCPFDRAPAAAFIEVDFAKTPLRTRIVHSAAAHAASITDRWSELGLLVRRFAKCVRLQGVVVYQRRSVPDFQLIVLEVPILEPGTLLEHDDFEAGCGEFLRHGS